MLKEAVREIREVNKSKFMTNTIKHFEGKIGDKVDIPAMFYAQRQYEKFNAQKRFDFFGRLKPAKGKKNGKSKCNTSV